MQAPKVFIVATRTEQNDATLKQSISTQFPSDFYEIGRGQWLVAFTGTAQELSVKLGIITPEKATAISGVVVFGVAGY